MHLTKNKLRVRLNLTAVFGLTLFMVILLSVLQGPLTLDITLLDFLAVHRQISLNSAIEWFSKLGSFRILALITVLVFLWLFNTDKRLALFFLTTMTSSGLLNELIKHWVGRPRPGVPWAVMEWTSYAFPSGHSMASATFALTFCLVWRRLYKPRTRPMTSLAVQLVLGIYVAAIGFTRAYLGAHYPSDIVAGWSAAAAWVAVMYGLFYRMDVSSEKTGNEV